MLKKSLVSPAQPRRAETRIFPCGVLASFKPSTLSRIFSDVGNTGGGLPFAKIHSRGERPSYLLGPPLAAALLGTRRVPARQGWAGEKSGLFEHPAESWPVVPDMRTIEIQAGLYRFSSTC
jgi:hypothetical protein